VTQLARRALAELVGTAFLVTAVIGSGIAAVRLSPNDVGLQLLENSLITGAALVALIVALQPVSAAFNPGSHPPGTGLRRHQHGRGRDAHRRPAGRRRRRSGCGELDVRSRRSIDRHPRPFRRRQWLGEVIATLGLLLVVFGAVRSGRGHAVAYAVGSYIAAAYWFTSSTSFANPAVTVARMLSDTFAGIAPASVPMFVLMQLIGGVLGFALLKLLYPDPAGLAADLSAEPAIPRSSLRPSQSRRA
jgi:glycerol uptake facilitator-like aquaporin